MTSERELRALLEGAQARRRQLEATLAAPPSPADPADALAELRRDLELLAAERSRLTRQRDDLADGAAPVGPGGGPFIFVGLVASCVVVAAAAPVALLAPDGYRPVAGGLCVLSVLIASGVLFLQPVRTSKDP